MTVTSSPLVITCSLGAVDETRLAQAAAIVRRGGVVAFPTETVYGLAVHAWDRAAVARLYQLKGRAADKQLTLHLWDARQVAAFARDVPPLAQRLIDALWPGPLTLILPGREAPTVGLRFPDHPVARAFLRRCRVSVAAPSANRSGQPEATEAAQVIATFGDEVDAVIDGGPTTYRQASTVIDATSEPCRVLREGAIACARLRALEIPFACA